MRREVESAREIFQKTFLQEWKEQSKKRSTVLPLFFLYLFPTTIEDVQLYMAGWPKEKTASRNDATDAIFIGTLLFPMERKLEVKRNASENDSRSYSPPFCIFELTPEPPG